MNELIPVAHFRLTQLLLSMSEAAKAKDKAHLIDLLSMFQDDYDGFVDLLANEAGLTDADIQQMVPEGEAELLTQAAVAQHGYRLPIVVGEEKPVHLEASPQDEQTPPR